MASVTWTTLPITRSPGRYVDVRRFWPQGKAGWATAIAATVSLAAALWILYRTGGALMGLPVPLWLRWPVEYQLLCAAAAVAASCGVALWLTARKDSERHDEGFPPPDHRPSEGGPYDSPLP